MATKDTRKAGVKIEEVLEDLGGYGWYQKMLTFLTIYPQATAAMIVLCANFTGSSHVPMYCKNDTTVCGENCTKMEDDDVYTSIVQEWDLWNSCSKGWIADTITSCQMIGMMTGAMTFSLISDNIGRKKAYFLVVAFMSFFGMLPSVSTSPAMYGVFKFSAGFGMSGVFVVLLALLMEFLTPAWRPLCGALSLWPVGEMFLGLVTYFVPSWRIVTVITGLPVLFVLLFFPYVQESPRWLLTRKRTEEAHEILCKIAKWNSKPAPAYSVTLKAQNTVLAEEAEISRGIAVVREILRDRRLRLHLAILTWSTMVCSIVYYGTTFGAKNLGGNPHLNIVYMGLFDLAAVPAVLCICNRLGRKRTYLLYTNFSTAFLVAVIIMFAISGDPNAHPLLEVLFSLLARFGIVCVWSCLMCMVLESFPTSLRSSCYGFTLFAGYLAGIVAPQSALLKFVSPIIPPLLYAVLAISTSVLSIFLPEMKDVPLLDTVQNEEELK